MTLRLLLVAACAVGIAVVSSTSATEAASPPLQLPWPTGAQHRIFGAIINGVVVGGNSYGCGTHAGVDQYSIDFDFGFDEPVSAIVGGTVSSVVSSTTGYGWHVIVDHGAGYASLYGHLNRFGTGITQGVQVTQGQTVGYSDSTGYSTGNHLHLRVTHNGSAYKPEPMSRVTGFGDYGVCPIRTSSYWTSWPPYATIEGGLVRGSDDKVYIISNAKKRWITSASAFNNCGYRWGEIMALPDSAINMISPDSNVGSAPCPKTLVRGIGADPVYHVDSWYKRWISSSTVFNGCKYDWGDIVDVSQSALSSYYTLPSINAPPCPYVRDPWYNEALIEGSLIQIEGDDPVYVIAGGQKRHIASSQVLSNCGYKTNDKIAVPGTIVNLIPTGDPLTSINSPPCPYTLITGSGPEVYVVLSTVKQHVSSRPVFDACGYVWGEIVQLTDTQVNSVPSTTSLGAPPCPFTRQ